MCCCGLFLDYLGLCPTRCSVVFLEYCYVWLEKTNLPLILVNKRSNQVKKKNKTQHTHTHTRAHFKTFSKRKQQSCIERTWISSLYTENKLMQYIQQVMRNTACATDDTNYKKQKRGTRLHLSQTQNIDNQKFVV